MNSAVHRSADSELSREPIDAIAALDLAISYAYKAGFTRAFISMKTESCYFTHPGRPGVPIRNVIDQDGKKQKFIYGIDVERVDQQLKQEGK